MPLPLLMHELRARSSDLSQQLSGVAVAAPVTNFSNLTSQDPLGEKNEWLRIVVALVSALSMLGAVLIILSYVCISSIRTRSREILVHLSLADFGVACANFVGVVVDFDRYIRSCKSHEQNWCNDVYNLCTTQAFFAGFSTIASILWTLALSVYIYLLVVHEPRKLHTKAVYAFYVLCWGLPLLISMWLVLTGRLGHSARGGSGWCSLKIEQENRSTGILITVLGNDLWIYLTVVLVTVLYFTTHCHIRQHLQVTLYSSRHPNTGVVSSVDMKFLLIPLAFLLLRLGSMVVIIVYVYAQAKTSLTVAYILLCIAGIGDSGQGFVNAVLFCVFTAKVREKLKMGLMRLRHCGCCGERRSYNYDLQYTTNSHPTETGQDSKKVVMAQNA